MRSKKINNLDPAANSFLKKGLVAAIGVLFLMSVYAIYWMLMASQSKQSLNNWIAERRVEGINIEFKHLRFQGFPFRLGMHLDGLTIKNTNTTMRKWSWRIPTISAWVYPWRPDHVWFDVFGGQNLFVGSKKEQKNYKIKALRFGGDIALGAANRGQLNINIGGLVVESARIAPVQVRHSEINLDWQILLGSNGVKEPFQFGLVIKGVELPHDWGPPLGTNFSTLRLAGKLTGLWPYGSFIEGLKRWRDAGGTIDISRLATEYGPLNLEVEGTLALDKQMQPLVALIARAEGYIDTVEALVDAELLQPNEGTAVKLALAIMAKRPEDRPAYVEMPLTVQNQMLSVGNFNLVRVPIVRWDYLQELLLSGDGKNARLSP